MTRFPNLEWLTECTFTRPNSSKEIVRLIINYFSLEELKVTTQDKMYKFERLLLRGLVIHIFNSEIDSYLR